MAEVSPIQYKENVRHYTPPTIHLPYKYKVFGVESEILIKYKRIKWTPSRMASLFLPGRCGAYDDDSFFVILLHCSYFWTNKKYFREPVSGSFSFWWRIQIVFGKLRKRNICFRKLIWIETQFKGVPANEKLLLTVSEKIQNKLLQRIFLLPLPGDAKILGGKTGPY